ncbi:hypothetical protein XSR1_160039 [Xenorhabdus szentirmaii DSM 16338]|uniref:Uncharacterized protein n=1 Tax=Xenorhabdus szentirmaii DSM 16338 TaxID=1427518 RepID=W1ITQ2_9GAMM|nr:hypothetical protein XSR1_160039 [Xenorhabdus szentirmaii DSM 16338]
MANVSLLQTNAISVLKLIPPVRAFALLSFTHSIRIMFGNKMGFIGYWIFLYFIQPIFIV